MQYKSVEMTGRNLAIAFACTALLSGCTGMVDSLSSHLRNLPENTPKGYALYLDAQDELKEKDYSSAALFFCSAADLGYSKANSECAKLSIIGASEDAPNYVKEDPKDIYKLSESAKQHIIADMMRRRICNAAEYGEPAKSLCKKIKSMSDSATIKAVHNAKNQYFNAVKNQRLKTLKEKDKGLSLKLEDF